jgi:hypothetical protein
VDVIGYISSNSDRVALLVFTLSRVESPGTLLGAGVALQQPRSRRKRAPPGQEGAVAVDIVASGASPPPSDLAAQQLDGRKSAPAHRSSQIATRRGSEPTLLIDNVSPVAEIDGESRHPERQADAESDVGAVGQGVASMEVLLDLVRQGEAPHSAELLSGNGIVAASKRPGAKTEADSSPMMDDTLNAFFI